MGEGKTFLEKGSFPPPYPLPFPKTFHGFIAVKLKCVLGKVELI